MMSIDSAGPGPITLITFYHLYWTIAFRLKQWRRISRSVRSTEILYIYTFVKFFTWFVTHALIGDVTRMSNHKRPRLSVTTPITLSGIWVRRRFFCQTSLIYLLNLKGSSSIIYTHRPQRYDISFQTINSAALVGTPLALNYASVENINEF